MVGEAEDDKEVILVNSNKIKPDVKIAFDSSWDNKIESQRLSTNGRKSGFLFLKAVLH